MPCDASPPINPSDGWMTSGYGMRIGRTSGALSYHAGIDMNAREGDPVFCVRKGVVEHVLSNESSRRGFNGYGNAVVVRHPADRVWTLYAHMKRTAVTVGENVSGGTFLGLVGRTNNGKFPGMPAHLHFEVRHAIRGGGSPFPGPYAVNNEDPERYLEEHGVDISWRGRFDLSSNVCRPWQGLVLHGLHLGDGPDAGAGGTEESGPAMDFEADYNADYEPPRSDFVPLILGNNLLFGGAIVLGLIGAAGAVGLADWDLRRRRRARLRGLR